MTLCFQAKPGAHERRLQRLAGNPLFPPALQRVSQEQIIEAQRKDADELVQFMETFQGLIQEAVSLEPTVESDVILGLKERLDRCYEQVSSLAGDQTQTKNAIDKLIAVVMGVVRKNAQDDPHALHKLADEDAARESHFQLQNHPLVADLMREDGIISPEELVATLLSEPQESLGDVLQLFDPAQLTIIATEARTLLETCEQQNGPQPEAWARILDIESAASQPAETLTIN